MASKSSSAESGGTVKLKAVAATRDRPATAEAKAPTPRVVAKAEAAPAGETLRKADFVDRVVEVCGVKKRDAKPAVEAALAELAKALIAGEELQLPPLGKLRVAKVRELDGGAKMLTLKLRTMKTGEGD